MLLLVISAVWFATSTYLSGKMRPPTRGVARTKNPGPLRKAALVRRNHLCQPERACTEACME